MNRILNLVCALVLGFLAIGPADASPGSRPVAACRASIEEGLDLARGNPEQASFSDGGWHRASFAPHLTTPLMAASFRRYCETGGRLGYLDYVRTFVRTNGFFGFGMSPDQAAERLRQDASLGSRASPMPPVIVLTGDMPRPHAFVSLTGLRLNLPDLHRGILHIDAREMFAVVSMGGRVQAFWQGQWMELYPDRERPAAAPSATP
ncbi:hypothetical protein [Phreatobacter sp.]|uniref:hypothetical protein n=1 Tax=Phreatobacter sp. TaxID=1966341 RepID=UPI003F6EDF0C